MNSYTIEIPKGYKVDRECPIDWDIDGTALMSIVIKPFSNVRYIVIRPYQLRVDNKIIEIPIGTKIIEEKESYATTLMFDYDCEDLKGKRKVKKSMCEYNPTYFKPVINEDDAN